MSVGVARAAGASPALRGLRGPVLAKCIRGAQLVPSFKLGCDSESAFGWVKLVAACSGIVLVWCEGDALPPMDVIWRSNVELTGRAAQLA